MARSELAPVAGFVLAGGASRRMGRDKALLPSDGSVLLRRIARIVVEAAGSCAIVAPAGRYESLGLPVLADRWPGEGPLGGLITALEAAPGAHCLAVAVDMPYLDSGILRELIAAADSCGRSAIPVHSGGKLEPLCAVYRAEAAAPLRRFFDGGGRRMMDALREIPIEPIPVRPEVFANVNTPEQWEAARI